jgi:hypothetical protein
MMLNLALFAMLFCAEGQAFSPLRDLDAMNARRYFHWVNRQSVRDPHGAYRTAQGIHREIKPLVIERPGVVRPFVLGHSVERRPIWGFRVSRPGTEIHTKVLVFAGIHALEWISTEAATAFLTDVARLTPRGVETVVVPLLNPDGREKVEQDLMAGRVRYRRGNARNVDLNRDFAVNRPARAIWRHLIPAYYRSTKAPLSQPESKALDRLLAAENFDVAVSLHAFGGFVYTPWAGLWARPDDWARLHSLGTTMSEAQGAHAYKVRQLSRWGFFFRAHGAEIDHIYGEYGTLSFLIELTRSGLSPTRLSTLKTPFDWYNPARAEPHIEKGVRALRSLIHTLSIEGGVDGID